MQKLFSLVVFFFISLNSFAQIPAYVPTNGLRCWYPFNGNADDQSSGSNHLTNVGATLTSDRFSQPNKAYFFDGLSNYLTRPGFNLGSTFTVSFWTTMSDYPVGVLGRAFFSYGFGGSSGYSVKYDPQSTLSVILHGVSFNCTNSTFVPSLDKWYNYVYVRNGTSHSLYINGILSSKGTASPIQPPSDILNIGAAKNAPNTTEYSNFVKGKIDDVGVWNRVLSQSEIENLYDGGGNCFNSISVTDTLVINTFTGVNPIQTASVIKLFPNPANTQITMEVSNLASVSGYTLKIVNTIGQQVFLASPLLPTTTFSISSLGQAGVYKVILVDASGNIMESRNLVIQ